MADAICDTSPLQYLHQVDQLRLLPDLYRRIVVPEAVAAELAEGRRAGVELPDPAKLPWVDLVACSPRPEPAALGDLGPGEAAVVALALERADALAILDDGLARRVATASGVRVVGTLGILLRAKQTGRLAAVAPVLRRLDDRGFRLDAATRAAVLRLAQESV